VTSASCGLQTSTRNRSVTIREIERLLPVWIEECNQNRIPLAEQPCIQKALNLFKGMREIIMKWKKRLMQVLVDLIDLKIEFSCMF
jgi:bifunctional DNase/RNase